MTGALFADDDIQLFGRKRTAGSLFKLTIKGSDLQDYVFNQVTFPPSMYMGLEQRIIAVQQIMGGNVPFATRRWAIEFLGITDHPDEMMKEIDSDRMAEVDFQKKMAQAAQPPQGGGGGNGATPPSPLEQAVSMEHGSTKPKDMGGGPAALGAGAQTPPSGGSQAASAGGSAPAGAASLNANVPPNPDVGQVDSGLGGTSLADQVRSTIEGVALKGSAYLTESQGGKRVAVYVPDRRDMLKLRRTLYPLFTRGRVTVKETKKIPEGAQEVKGRGTQAPGQVQQQGQ